MKVQTIVIISILGALSLGMACRPTKLPMEPQPLEVADVCVPYAIAETCEDQAELIWKVTKPNGDIETIRGKVAPGTLYRIFTKEFGIKAEDAHLRCNSLDSEPGQRVESRVKLSEACAGPPVALWVEVVR